MHTGRPFQYRTASPEEIQAKGAELIGRSLDEISDVEALRRPSSAKTKGLVGQIYETFFGIESNSRAEPDFIGAGIELKSVPVLVGGTEARAKERISLGMIDWEGLAHETWATASARKKLEHLMLIFYAWHPLRPIGYFSTLVAGLWKPDQTSLATIESDWVTIQDLVRAGRRADVSESLTVALGAATKGAGHGSTSRAWSLKQPYVTWIYRSMVGDVVIEPKRLVADPEAEFEAETLRRLRAIEGRTIQEVVGAIGPVSGAKSASASAIRKYLGLKASGRSGDFERFGVEVKTVPINGDGRPIESTSFPSFVHEELAFETWEDSDLLGRLNRILFIPIRRDKGQPQADSIVGQAFFWSPAERDLIGIREEWEDFRRRISAGLAKQLPTASHTKFIHVRPKARNASDTDWAPGGFDVTRKSFWLNSGYVEEIIRANVALGS